MRKKVIRRKLSPNKVLVYNPFDKKTMERYERMTPAQKRKLKEQNDDWAMAIGAFITLFS
jgi:hypothetical protein